MNFTNFHLYKLLLVTCLFICASLLFSYQAKAQDTEDDEDTISAKSFELNLGTGFGMYGMHDNDPKSESSATVTGLLQIGGSYDVARKFNVGIIIERLGFATNKDSSQQKAKAFNVGLSFKYLPMVKAKSSIFLHVTLGTCSFKYDNLKTSTRIDAGSYFFEPGIGFNHYWSKHIGYYLTASYFYTKFSKLVNKSNTPITITNANGGQDNLWLLLSGMHLNIGLIYKL
jgi:hypothetical protein